MFYVIYFYISYYVSLIYYSLYKDAWICAYVHILIYIQAKIPIIMIIMV